MIWASKYLASFDDVPFYRCCQMRLARSKRLLRKRRRSLKHLVLATDQSLSMALFSSSPSPTCQTLIPCTSTLSLGLSISLSTPSVTGEIYGVCNTMAKPLKKKLHSPIIVGIQIPVAYPICTACNMPTLRSCICYTLH